MPSSSEKKRWRGTTAKAIFAEERGIDCLSAGPSHDSENPLTTELAKWADLVFVMKIKQKAKLRTRYKEQLSGVRVICLGIPDKYPFIVPALIKLLKTRVTPGL